MKRVAYNRLSMLPSACVLSLMATVAWSQTLTWLGTPIGNTSIATAVSNDGMIIAGRAGTVLAGSLSADSLLWNRRTNTVQQLSTGGGTVWMMTPDGNKIAASESLSSRPHRAFIWTPEGKQYLPGYSTLALCINRSGTLVGGGWNYGSGNHPILWDANTRQIIFAESSLGGEMWGVSDDGSKLLLYTWSLRARVWYRSSNTLVTLLPHQNDPYTLGFKLTPDGKVVVGTSGSIYEIWTGVGNNYRAAMWREDNSWRVEPLANLGGQRGIAYDIKGNTIVGFVSTPSGENRAVRWRLSTATTQVEDLNQTYGALLSSGSRLRIAFGASYNERFIVGVGYNAATGREEAFLLDTRVCNRADVDGNGCIDDADLLQVLYAYGATDIDFWREDINCDGVVDDADLLQVLFGFGSGC